MHSHKYLKKGNKSTWGHLYSSLINTLDVDETPKFIIYFTTIQSKVWHLCTIYM